MQEKGKHLKIPSNKAIKARMITTIVTRACSLNYKVQSLQMDILKEIYEDAHTYELKSSDSSVGRNLSLIITWLEATFPELADPQMEGDDVLVLSARPHALLDASLALQGPLVHASHGREKNGTDVSSSYCEGKPIVVKNLSGPRAIIIPPSTSLRSLNPDSIEGRSTLHHHIKLFHENYVEYAHKVYIELEQHGDYVKTIIENQLNRVKEVEQSLLKVRNNEKGIEDRIAHAFKVYELLEQRLQNFKALPASNKKPLSKAERQFDADLDRISDQELDALKSSMEALDARLKRYVSSSPDGSSITARQAQEGERLSYRLSSFKAEVILGFVVKFNIENTRKVRLIEDRLSRQHK
ncbi:hypothetical protein HPP92_019878 [Vanilla planifolia]|uniref:Uncharacterized protein n=1 Tax=Vanilla planifolia TaxID=51239 RepID=A0A835UHY9_VANPL|nr:hypothetical protein HPP92_019878 [Vanilla planifolia]